MNYICLAKLNIGPKIDSGIGMCYKLDGLMAYGLKALITLPIRFIRRSGRISRALVSCAGDPRFKPRSSKTYKIDTCQDNVTEWGIRLWCWLPGFAVGCAIKSP